MKILITGATGFIGKNIVKRLHKKNKIICLIRKETNRKNINFLHKLNVNLVYADITNFSSLKKITKKADVVIHLAAKLMDETYDEDQYYRVNVLGTKNIVTLSELCEIKLFIFLSTAGVYGPCINASEDSVLMPKNVYEKTKAKAENHVINSGLNYVILRPGIIFGPYDKRFIKIFHVANKGFFPLIGRGDNLIQPLFVDDFSSIIEKILKIKNKIINVAGNEKISLKEFIKKINPKVKFVCFPKILLYLASKILDFIEKTLKVDLLLNSNRFNFFTESRTYNITKLKKITKQKFTSIETGIHKTNKWLEHK